MKMLMFDLRESEKPFFAQNSFTDFDITFFEEALTEKTVLTEEQYRETDVLSVFTSSNLTDEILSKFINLRVVITRSTGYGHIDTRYCMGRNIAVLHVEQYGKKSVAEFTLGLLIALIRNFLPAIADMKNNVLIHSDYEGQTLGSLTIGIIGSGAIGCAMVKLAHFLGMKVLVYSFQKNPEIDNLCEYVSFEELLKNSDVISLHAEYTGENYHMISKEQFDIMKDGVYIINTARGELIDIQYLYDNLVTGKIRGAAIDVFECEYLSLCTSTLGDYLEKTNPNCIQASLITQKLLNLKNVIITPHIAYNTTQAINYILEATFNNVRDYFKGIYNGRVC